MVPIEKSEKEVLDFHQSLRIWLSGSTSNADDGFAPIENGLAEDFSYVMPEGITVDKGATVEVLKQAHGVQGQDFRIWIKHFDVIANSNNICLVRYEEWQRLEDASITGRISTVALRANEAQPNGVEWLYVHETWLPEDSIASFCIPVTVDP